ncbi:MAG TPA: MFS transporter [Alphaproteobacteria bacterium]|nr:MFS transporter [Alphaproteobacteria bacterium]
MADIPLNERSSAPATAVSAAPSAEAPARSGAWPSPVRAWYTLVILTIAFMFSILDRTILSLMIEPIKKDLVISDFEVSLLLGPAFVMIYAFSSLPISRIADWASRKVIIAAGLAFWSFATACCGLAQSYWPLFIARTGVGAGESSFAPATYSILADLFPREKLAIATGFLSIGYSYGAAVALILGGAVIGLVRNMPNTVVPGLGVIHPWQWTFIIVGVPGILLALFFQATVKEPARQGKFRPKNADGSEIKSVPVGEVFKFLAADWKCYAPIFSSIAIRSLAVGVATWIPSFFVRTYHWSIPEVGLAQGLILLLATPPGIWLGGLISQRWTRKNMWDCNLRLSVIASVIILPTSILYPLAPSPYLALGLMAFNGFVASIGAGPATAALQLITPNQMRGQINSLNLLTFNIFAAAGPTFVAVFTDFVFHKNADLKYSIMLVALAINPIATFISWLGLKPYGRSVKRAQEQFA